MANINDAGALTIEGEPLGGSDPSFEDGLRASVEKTQAIREGRSTIESVDESQAGGRVAQSVGDFKRYVLGDGKTDVSSGDITSQITVDGEEASREKSADEIRAEARERYEKLTASDPRFAELRKERTEQIGQVLRLKDENSLLQHEARIADSYSFDEIADSLVQLRNAGVDEQTFEDAQRRAIYAAYGIEDVDELTDDTDLLNLERFETNARDHIEEKIATQDMARLRLSQEVGAFLELEKREKARQANHEETNRVVREYLAEEYGKLTPDEEFVKTAELMQVANAMGVDLASEFENDPKVAIVHMRAVGAAHDEQKLASATRSFQQAILAEGDRSVSGGLEVRNVFGQFVSSKDVDVAALASQPLPVRPERAAARAAAGRASPRGIRQLHEQIRASITAADSRDWREGLTGTNGKKTDVDTVTGARERHKRAEEERRQRAMGIPSGWA